MLRNQFTDNMKERLFSYPACRLLYIIATVENMGKTLLVGLPLKTVQKLVWYAATCVVVGAWWFDSAKLRLQWLYFQAQFKILDF